MKYVKLKSWHVMKIPQDVIEDTVPTMCGRVAARGSFLRDTLPLDERSCERCLQLGEGKELNV
jgi:hypothetical protein